MMNESSWTTLFVETGIVEERAKEYAPKFVEEGILRSCLSEFDIPTLKMVGVNRIGDAMAILSIGKNKGADARGNRQIFAKTPTAKPPEANCNMTHQDFRKFCIDWEVYLNLTHIDDSQVHHQLYSCCDEEVQRALINTYDNFFMIPRLLLLKNLEAVVTRQSNPTVYRVKFGNMSQHDDFIQSYVVKLKSAARDCSFSCPQCEYDLSSQYVKDQLIKGLQSEALQTDILAKADQLDCLEKVVKHCEAFEAALRNQSAL